METKYKWTELEIEGIIKESSSKRSLSMKHTFAPYLKHLGKTPEEQLEKNRPLMTWLQQKMEKKWRNKKQKKILKIRK